LSLESTSAGLACRAWRPLGGASPRTRR